MMELYKITSLAIFGSCVSCDILRYDREKWFTLVDYTARSSFASAFSSKKFDTVPVEKLTSDFQQRLVIRDTQKKYPNILEKLHFDIICIDCIDERFPLLSNQYGALCTASSELRATDLPLSGLKRIQSGSEEFFSLGVDGWTAFVRCLDMKGALDRLCFNAVY